MTVIVTLFVYKNLGKYNGNITARLLVSAVSKINKLLQNFYLDILISGNEWKTRYETQIELNGQLERQMSLIHQRLEGLRGNPVGEFK